MPRSVSGVYTPTAGVPVVSGTTISSTVFNNLITDIGNEITASLPVAGTAPMTGALRAVLGSVSAPGYTFVGDTDTGIYSPGANQAAIVTGGTAAVTFSSTQTSAWTAKAVGKAFDVDAITSVASASTCDIGAAATSEVLITGTTTITSFGTSNAGIRRRGRFAGALTLTYNATSLILPGGVSITTAANDSFEALSLGSGNWQVTSYQSASIGTGGMTLLANGTVSAAATLDLALSSAYRQFKLFLWDILPATSGQSLNLRASQDNGATYISTASAYGYAGLNVNTSATGTNLGGLNTSLYLLGNMPNPGGLGSMDLTINPGSTGYNFTVVGAGLFTLSGNGSWNTVGGYLGATGVVTNIRLLFGSGNISNMKYALYGVS